MTSNRPSDVFDQLGSDAIIEARMLQTDRPVTESQIRKLRSALQGYKNRHALTWREMESTFGIAGTSLNQISLGTYKHANLETQLRKIDAILAKEKVDADRQYQQYFEVTKIVERCFRAFRTAIKLSSIGVLIAEPGTGKTAIAKAFINQQVRGVYIRVRSATATSAGLSRELCRELGIDASTKDERDRLLIDTLRGTNVYFIIDESQALRESGLELIRDIHDSTEIERGGLAKRTPFILIGDHDFYKLIVETKQLGRKAGGIKPQLARRMAPVYDIAKDLPHVDGDGNRVLYSEEEVEAIVQQKRLKLINPDAVKWLTNFSNIPNMGRLGMALRIFEMALELRRDRSIPVDVMKLIKASETVVGLDMLHMATMAQPKLASKSTKRRTA